MSITTDLSNDGWFVSHIYYTLRLSLWVDPILERPGIDAGPQ